MTREKGEDVIRLGDGEEKRGFEAELLSESKSYLFPLIMFVLLCGGDQSHRNTSETWIVDLVNCFGQSNF